MKRDIEPRSPLDCHFARQLIQRKINVRKSNSINPKFSNILLSANVLQHRQTVKWKLNRSKNNVRIDEMRRIFGLLSSTTVTRTETKDKTCSDYDKFSPLDDAILFSTKIYAKNRFVQTNALTNQMISFETTEQQLTLNIIFITQRIFFSSIETTSIPFELSTRYEFISVFKRFWFEFWIQRRCASCSVIHRVHHGFDRKTQWMLLPH